MNQGLTQRTLQNFKNTTRKEINGLKTSKNLRNFASKFKTQKKTLEMKVKRDIESHIKKANKYLATKTKELNDFQKTVTTMIKRKLKKNGKRD